MLTGALALVAFIGICRIAVGDGDNESSGPIAHENAQMLRFLLPGRGLVVANDQLVSVMSGETSTEDALVEGAFCVASLDWLWDLVHNPAIIVATDPALVRAAELYGDAILADDLEMASLIAQAEQAYWRRDANFDRLRDWADDLADDEQRAAARRYLDERQQPPSVDATRRFVIYAVQHIATQQSVFYLDTHRVLPGLLSRPASNPLPSEVLVAGEDELRSLNLDDCDDVADEWDRYDPTLPALPPIDQRWQLELDESI